MINNIHKKERITKTNYYTIILINLLLILNNNHFCSKKLTLLIKKTKTLFLTQSLSHYIKLICNYTNSITLK